MEKLNPIMTFFDATDGQVLPLPSDLAGLYGPLRFPEHPGRPFVFTNFVSTLDGVVTQRVPGHEGGGDISGFNPYDRLIMGLLRSVADVVIITSGSLRVQPKSLWTGANIFPDLADSYALLRQNMGKSPQPLHVVVTGNGDINPNHRVFSSGEVPAMIATTQDGAARLQKFGMPEGVRMDVVKDYGWISAFTILNAIKPYSADGLYLVEGGPHLVGMFFGDHKLDELFLSVAPQVAGRKDAVERLGFVAGRVLAPDQPTWGKLLSLRQAGDMLFTRYSFDISGEPPSSTPV